MERQDEEEKEVRERLEAYRHWLTEAEKSDATVEKYLRDVRAFLLYARDAELTMELLVGYKRDRLLKSYAVRSVNAILASLNSYLTFLKKEELRLRNVRVQRRTYLGEEQELTKAEYLRLLDAARDQPQLQLLMQTICGTGIRVSELKAFTVESVQTGSVVIRNKGKTRVVLIQRKLRKKLLTYAKRQGIVRGSIFLGRTGKPLHRSCIWARMKRLCEKAGVSAGKVFPHNLRKLFARTFYAMEKDIAHLADVLGHSSINTTRIYLMTSGREQRRQIEKLGLIL